MTTEPRHIISLGAGVQSSTMALMAARGLITPMPVAAVFADTQAEPADVYQWVAWLEKQLPFPVFTVCAGDLRADQLRVRVSKKSGNRYMKNAIPAFSVDKTTGKKGLWGRKCTYDFKIQPITRWIRQFAGIKRGQKTVGVKCWIGISIDEAHRMKPSKLPFIENIWPLIDLNMSRDACLKWMRDNGYPEPPRSACTFCPFHSDAEWLRVKASPHWPEVVQFDRELRALAATVPGINSVPFLHGSCKPIEEVEFETEREGYRQVSLFGNECEGLCGV